VVYQAHSHLVLGGPVDVTTVQLEKR
jgi:hypothetical protein